MSPTRDTLWKHGTAVSTTAAVNTTTNAYLDAGKVNLRQFIELTCPGALNLRWVHRPESLAQAELGRRRLAFDELFCVQLAMLERRKDWQDANAAPMGSKGVLEVYRESLPFALTEGQLAIGEELLLATQEMQAGARRKDALIRMADRCGVEDLAVQHREAESHQRQSRLAATDSSRVTPS